MSNFRPYKLLRYSDGAWRLIGTYSAPRGLKSAANRYRDTHEDAELAWTYGDGAAGLTGVHLRKSDPRYGVPSTPRAAPMILEYDCSGPSRKYDRA